MTDSLNLIPVSFTEASEKFPSIVYKYRFWDKPDHKTILTERQVYFASPSSFDDPLDCKIPVRYDLLSDEQIYKLYLLSSQENNPGFTSEQHEKYAKEWVKKTPLKNKRYLKEFESEYVKELSRFLGVLSLSATPSNKEMWMSYSQNHTGFAVGFNPLEAFKYFGGADYVRYVEELPIILPRPLYDFTKQYWLEVFHKLKKWEPEEEYRVQKTGFIHPQDERRKITLPPDAYSEVIFGAQINPKDKTEITQIIKANMPHVKLRQAQLDAQGNIQILEEQ